jgi:hypothetical protein
MKAVKQALLIVGALVAIMAWAFLRFAWGLKRAATWLVTGAEDMATPGVEPTVWPLKWFVRIAISFVAICMGVFFIFAAWALLGLWGFYVALVLVPFFSFSLIRRNWNAIGRYTSTADEAGESPPG